MRDCYLSKCRKKENSIFLKFLNPLSFWNLKIWSNFFENLRIISNTVIYNHTEKSIFLNSWQETMGFLEKEGKARNQWIQLGD